jgi:hypothetical protein
MEVCVRCRQPASIGKNRYRSKYGWFHHDCAKAKQEQLLWKEIERQSKIPSPLTEPLEITDEMNRPLL